MATPANRNAARHSTSGTIIESEDDDPGIRGLPSPTHHHLNNRRAPRAPSISTNPSTTTSISKDASNFNASAHTDKRLLPSSYVLTAGPRIGKSGNADPLMEAVISQSYEEGASPALKLDQFILGHTGVAAHEARGSMTQTRNAVSSLKDAFSSTKSQSSSLAVDIPRLKISQDDANVSLGGHSWNSMSSSGSSSGSSSSSESDMSPPMAGNDGMSAMSASSAASSVASTDTRISPELMTKATSNVTREDKPQSARDDFYIPLKQLIKQVCVAGLEPSTSRDPKFCLTVPQIKEICRAARDVFLSETALLRLEGPIKIVGDIHGQFKDLMRLFKRGGMPPAQHYLFLGDYVDRGKQSLETIVLLLLLKLRYPTRVHMLRGNHESAGITKVYGFYDECKRRSSVKAWRAFVDVFNTLPVAAIVGERIFCVHGGISPSLTSLDQIDALQRPTDVPDQGILADLLWSDPDPQVKEWSENNRGVSFCFGQRSLEWFCRQLDVDLVVRGHMVVENGYEFFGGRRLVTVFSAPNYCGDFDNSAAVMNVSDTLLCSFDVIEPRKVRLARHTLAAAGDSRAVTRHTSASKSQQSATN